MASNFFGAIGVTGGGTGALDAIDGNSLGDGDGALVIDATNNISLLYTLNATGGDGSGTDEVYPTLVIPDSNYGTKAWELCGLVNAHIIPGTTNAIVTINSDDNISDSGILITNVGQLGVATEWTRQQNFNEAAITSSGNATAWNIDTAQCALHTLTENTTISAPTNLNAGGTCMLRIVQAAGVYTLAWNAVFKWGTAGTPTAPAANGDVVVFSFYSDGTNLYGAEVCREEA